MRAHAPDRAAGRALGSLCSQIQWHRHGQPGLGQPGRARQQRWTGRPAAASLQTRCVLLPFLLLGPGPGPGSGRFATLCHSPQSPDPFACAARLVNRSDSVADGCGAAAQPEALRTAAPHRGRVTGPAPGYYCRAGIGQHGWSGMGLCTVTVGVCGTALLGRSVPPRRARRAGRGCLGCCTTTKRNT